MTYLPSDDNRKFTELYNVQRLRSHYIASDSQVCISTIQRLYSILKGEDLAEEIEERNPNENEWQPKEPMPVVYNAQIPIEEFDFIVIDECHRSIYKLWQQVLDYEDVAYTKKDLDRDVVNPSQIRNIIRTFKNKLPELFPGRAEVPKTLIFAKTDSHADDIILIVREEFNEGNYFCKKVTYKTEEDPKSLLAQFRNAYNPRIAVTVDMISTGTDVKPQVRHLTEILTNTLKMSVRSMSRLLIL